MSQEGFKVIYGTKSINTLQRQLHSRSVSFNNFKNITVQEIEDMKETIAAKKKFSEANNKSIDINSGLTNYQNTLRYLTNPTISQELKTFDEKILYLILSCDPELLMMETFIGSDITPSSRINDEEDEKKKQQLQAKRKEELDSFANKVRELIGFYDPNLLKYESILHRGLMKKAGLVSDVKTPSLESLLKRTWMVKNINIINNQNLIRLRAIASMWLNEAKDPQDLNSLAYNLQNRYRDLHIYNVEEQIILFILIADPELDLLRIFEEESNYKGIQRRAIAELGFYNKGLINVEQLYHDKFEPDKKLSAWTI